MFVIHPNALTTLRMPSKAAKVLDMESVDIVDGETDLGAVNRS